MIGCRPAAARAARQAYDGRLQRGAGLPAGPYRPHV